MIAPGDESDQHAPAEQIVDAEQQAGDDAGDQGENDVARLDRADRREAVEQRDDERIDEDDEDEVERASDPDQNEEREAAQGRAGLSAQCDELKPGDGGTVDEADHGAGQRLVMREGAIDGARGRAAGGDPEDDPCGRGDRHGRIIVPLPFARGLRTTTVQRRRARGPAPGSRRAVQSPLPSWLILDVATSSIMTRSCFGTGIGVHARSPSMKKMRPPLSPSTWASAALSP